MRYLKFLHGGKMNPMATKTARMEMEEQNMKIPAAAHFHVLDGGAIVLIVSTKYYAVLVQHPPLL
jgi:hypothetical protein